MASIKSVSVRDDDLWEKATKLSQRRSDDGRPNISKLIHDLLYAEVVVKEVERDARVWRTPATKLRALAITLSKAAEQCTELANTLDEEQSGAS